MNLFVTGATGFIGSHVVRQAFAAGHRVTALRRSASQSRIPLTEQRKWVESPLDNAGLVEHLRSCSVLVHLVAVGIVGPADWQHCFDVNVRQSLACWQHALEAGVRRLVVCGSCAEYGQSGERFEFIPTDAPLEPVGAYAASKAAASMAALGLAQEANVELAILRPFQVFGEGEAVPRLWPALRQAAHQGTDFAMTPGEQIRDFVPVHDVAREILEFAVERPLKAGEPEIHHLGTGQPLSLRAFAEHWWTEWKATGKLKVGALPYRPNEVMRFVPLISRP